MSGNLTFRPLWSLDITPVSLNGGHRAGLKVLEKENNLSQLGFETCSEPMYEVKFTGQLRTWQKTNDSSTFTNNVLKLCCTGWVTRIWLFLKLLLFKTRDVPVTHRIFTLHMFSVKTESELPTSLKQTTLCRGLCMLLTMNISITVSYRAE